MSQAPWKTTAVFFQGQTYATKARVGMDVLVGLTDPRPPLNGAIRVCTGRIVAVDETYGAAIVGIVEPYLTARWGAEMGQQLAGLVPTQSVAALAGDPLHLGHFEWMPDDGADRT